MEALIRTAKLIQALRYADAAVVLAAGSLVRGEGTAYSDIDLVVIYPKVSCAYRESFRFQEYPVEAFVHDPETLNYFFFDVDRPSGIPALPQMVTEGIEITESTELSQTLKELAISVIAMGPPLLSEGERERLRYGISDLLDDLRDPRSQEELLGTGAQLYEAMANYFFRARGSWSARGKAIPGAMRRVHPDLGETYCRCFEDLFERRNAQAVINFGEELLRPDGGLLFDGYRLNAPAEWRKPLGPSG